jgi:hypothetical protein
VDCSYPISKIIKLAKKAIALLDAVTSVPYSRKGLGYTIGRGLDAVLLFTCYSYWFSCYFDQRGKLMKALIGQKRLIKHPYNFQCRIANCIINCHLQYLELNPVSIALSG